MQISTPKMIQYLGDWHRRLNDAVPSRRKSGYIALADALRAAILSGHVPLGAKTPGERQLATALDVSRTMVASAYQVLREEGWLTTHQRSGSVITMPESLAPSMRDRGSRAFGWKGIAVLPGHTRQPVAAASAEAELIDLTTAPVSAPDDSIVQAAAGAAALLPGYVDHDGYYPQGLPQLREAIAAMYDKCGVPTDPETIVITSGAQQAFNLIVDELSGPGERILVECPTYPASLDVVRARKRQLVSVRMMDTEPWWDLDGFASILRAASPRLAYMLPDFQNPTGALMTAQQRTEVVRLARRSGTPVVVDETSRFTAFDPSSLPKPLCYHDSTGVVITVGSLSKALWGGLRVGWIRATKELATRMVIARARADMSGSVLDQLTAVALLTGTADVEGLPAALWQQSQRLKGRCDSLAMALAEQLPHWQTTVPDGGISLWVRREGGSAAELARRAAEFGVAIVSGSRFGDDGTMDNYLRLPFTAESAVLIEGVKRLAAAEASLLSGPASPELALGRLIT